MIIALTVYLAIGLAIAYSVNRAMPDREGANSLAVLFALAIFWLPTFGIVGPVALREIREDAREAEHVRKIHARAVLRSFGETKRSVIRAQQRWCAIRAVASCKRNRRITRFVRPSQRSRFFGFILRVIEGRP